jgi:hypothetical protein
MIIGGRRPRKVAVVVVVVVIFLRIIIIEINNVIMKIKWREMGSFLCSEFGNFVITFIYGYRTHII